MKTEKPILFSGPMVKAILEGRKTQTRRVVKDVSEYACLTGDCDHSKQVECDAFMSLLSPYGIFCDKLWVKETWRPVDHDFAMEKRKECPGAWLVQYRSDNANVWGCPDYDDRKKLAKKFGTANTAGGCDSKWRPSIFMPRWASRITLEITGVRVERVQEISESDAKAEGVEASKAVEMKNGDPCYSTPYQILWNQINGTGSWESNPWVWVIEFKKL